MKIYCKTIHAIFLLPLLFTVLTARPSEHTAEKIVRTALQDQRGYQLLGELCALGPRLSGSSGALKAIQWARSVMKKAAFDSVWLQPVIVPNWQRGKIELAEIIEPEIYSGRKLSIAALGGSVGTPATGISGAILKVDSLGELTSGDLNPTGKLVFYDGKFDDGLLNTFSAYGKAVGQRTKGAIEAARAAAIGTIVRSVTSLKDNTPHTGVMYYQDSIPKIPAVAIGMQDADFLSQLVDQGENVNVNLTLSCQTYDSTLSYNVIGEIRGSEFPDEVIVVGGHIDAWDKGHGAHDDGAGCIQAIEVLDLLQRVNLRPKRTIRCVLFIDEEQRQSGAKAYAARVDSLNEIHIAAIESDRGAFTPRGFNVQADSSILARMQKWLPLLRKAGIEWIRKGGSGADISKIKHSQALIGYVPDIQRYFDLHHSANDTFDKVHPREMELGTAAMTILTWLISEEGL